MKKQPKRFPTPRAWQIASNEANRQIDDLKRDLAEMEAERDRLIAERNKAWSELNMLRTSMIVIFRGLAKDDV